MPASPSPAGRPRPTTELPAALARPRYPAELPITPRIGEIVACLRRHRVLIVAGETGSGKTTQLPKACLEAGLGRRGRIAHTQPRRLAARTVSARIAEELGVELGAEVGYAVRFADRTSDATVVSVMTDGLLLAELQRNPQLRGIEAVIVDEAHERSLNIDFILGCLKRTLQRRRDFKLIVTSATIDVDAFSAFFGGAPVIEVEGRSYPVRIVYRPVEGDSQDALVDCLQTIADEAPSGRRDILVFQSGEREIFHNAQRLKRAFAERFDILPLYARLGAAEQRRVFQPGGRQRVVLATNVAETSITVPNIGYVVDPGFARISRYSPRAKLQRLPVEPISQASAAQRAGRCGRVAPGTCYRLYSEADHAVRPAFTDPELKRSNLAAVVLALRAFHFRRPGDDVARFPFIDPPSPAAVRDAERLLHELGALRGGALTETGAAMARLPVDPRLARMLIEAGRTGALSEALIVVSALAADDPRRRPYDRRAAADQAHAEFECPVGQSGADGEEQPARQDVRASDFLTCIRLWNWLEGERAKHARSAFDRLLEARFLSARRVREWRALHRQLLLACRDIGLRPNSEPADYGVLHRALLTGSLGFIGRKREPDARAAPARGGASARRRFAEYDGPRGLRFKLSPASALRRAAPDWLVAAEISDSAASGSGQTFARCVAAIEPAWIEQAAPHLAKSSFSEPAWDARRGEAMVRERVTVYGLAVVDGRRRRAADVDAEAARRLFIEYALVRRAEQPPAQRLRAGVLDRNERLAQEIAARQARGRRADMLLGEAGRAAFYHDRLPDDVCSPASWQRFLQCADAQRIERLAMTEADLTGGATQHLRADDFPSCLALGAVELPLAYKFAPGEPDDGVSVRVDLAGIAQLDGDSLDWLVPGFFAEKCEALLRSLPKSLRRQLAPLTDRVRAIVPQLEDPAAYRRGRLTDALTAALLRNAGVAVPPDAWRIDTLAPHLRMNIQVRGTRRRLIDQDRDLAALRARVLRQAERTLSGDARAAAERHGLVAFPEDGVSAQRIVRGAAGPMAIYPVLVDRGRSVDLLARTTPQRQTRINRGGYTRLALLAETRRVAPLRREVERDTALGLGFAPLGGLGELADALLETAVWFAYFDCGGRPLPATATDFAARLAAEGPQLAAVFRELHGIARIVLDKRAALVRRIAALESPAFAASRADLAAQLDVLAGADFARATPHARFADLPRYLDGMALRIDGLQGRVARDAAGMEAIAPWQRRLLAFEEAGGDGGELAFALQEYRIATFSQRLGTRGKISAKRLDALFRAAEAELAVDGR